MLVKAGALDGYSGLIALVNDEEDVSLSANVIDCRQNQTIQRGGSRSNF